jgi:hypothetical protein
MKRTIVVAALMLLGLVGATLWAAHSINTAPLPSADLVDRNVPGKTTGAGRSSLASPE